jgi:hypothetical protein
MYKLVPVLVLTAVAGVSIPVPVVAAQRLMASLSGPSAADTVVPQAASCSSAAWAAVAWAAVAWAE